MTLVGACKVISNADSSLLKCKVVPESLMQYYSFCTGILFLSVLPRLTLAPSLQHLNIVNTCTICCLKSSPGRRNVAPKPKPTGSQRQNDRVSSESSMCSHEDYRSICQASGECCALQLVLPIGSISHAGRVSLLPSLLSFPALPPDCFFCLRAMSSI